MGEGGGCFRSCREGDFFAQPAGSAGSSWEAGKLGTVVRVCRTGMGSLCRTVALSLADRTHGYRDGAGDGDEGRSGAGTREMRRSQLAADGIVRPGGDESRVCERGRVERRRDTGEERERERGREVEVEEESCGRRGERSGRRVVRCREREESQKNGRRLRERERDSPQPRQAFRANGSRNWMGWDECIVLNGVVLYC